MFAPLLDRISARTAFFPPSPATYTIERHGDGTDEYFKPLLLNLKKVPRAKASMIPISSSQNAPRIAVAYIPAPRSTGFTLLHCHGNAVDLGQLLPFYEQLAKLLGINVIGFDYRGYGKSEGSPAMSFAYQASIMRSRTADFCSGEGSALWLLIFDFIAE
jgi:abhydrolase domain-containing protein 17